MIGSGLRDADVLRLYGIKLKAGIKVSFPARIVRLVDEGRRADLQPEIDENVEAISGERIVSQLPIIPAVKIVWPRSKTFAITWELSPADTVLVVCADRNIGEWMRARSTNPGDTRMHTLDGAVAFPGLYSDDDDLAEVPNDCISLRSLAGDGAEIQVRDDEVRLGARTASQYVALANLVKARLDTIQAAFDGHIHSGGTISGNTGAPAAPIGALAGVAAEKVKAL